MEEVLGVILAGGRSLRMGGGDKCLCDLAGRPILERIIHKVESQVSELIINANGDPKRFAPFGLPVVPDVIEGFAGPLAGILTAMDWTAVNRPRTPWVASFPADAPFLPSDVVTRMLRAVDTRHGELACATSGGRTHPVCGLWRVDLADELRQAMLKEGIRKIDLWTARRNLVEVEFATELIDPFFNVNCPEDLLAARTHAAYD